MDVSQFAQKARFPTVWLELGLLDGQFFEAQAREFEREYASCEPEGGTEHWRYGAFLHWVRSKPSEEALHALVEAALQDPDRPMAGNVLLELVALPTFSRALIEHVLAVAPSRKELGVAPQRLRSAFSAAHAQP